MRAHPLRVVGVVLAAGRSTRMGRAKALLGAGPGGDTFVSRNVRTLLAGGVEEVVVVGRPEDAALRDAVNGVGGRARYVENPNADRGQLSSVLAAVDDAEASGADAVVVLPVDVPCVRAETVDAVIAAAASGSYPIVRATHLGQHGHPVLFRSTLFGELRRANPDAGARQVVRANPARVLDLEVGDPGVLRDVDVPADYADLFGDLPPAEGNGP